MAWLPPVAAEDSFPLNAWRILFPGDTITNAGGYFNSIDLQLRLRSVEPMPELLTVGLPSESCTELFETDHRFRVKRVAGAGSSAAKEAPEDSTCHVAEHRGFAPLQPRPPLYSIIGSLHMHGMAWNEVSGTQCNFARSTNDTPTGGRGWTKRSEGSPGGFGVPRCRTPGFRFAPTPATLLFNQ
ncbi:MAG TPA: hypothetical protein PLY87_23640 [Planctomycetaceae bacterium]|nr:hypothetical protein [Planctomycetaceae bacterium]